MIFHSEMSLFNRFFFSNNLQHILEMLPSKIQQGPTK